MKQLVITFLILGAIFLNRSLSYSQTTNLQTENLTAWIDSCLTRGLDSLNIAGATIVLIQNDSVLHINGYGLADIESNTKVDFNSSIFGVGSVSKTFVATAVMQLVEEGKLKLDQDINKYLTSFQFEYKFNTPITVRHLLTHTSGLDNWVIGTSVRVEENIIPLAHYLKEQTPLQIKPSGQAIAYSNNGYALLGLIVEEVSGIPFYEYVRENILKPLEMSSSSFKRLAKHKTNYVTSYWQMGKQLIPYKPDFKLDYPSGALNSTASDMGHYISMFLNNGNYKGRKILDSATVAKMFHKSFKHFPKAKCGRSLAFPESNWYRLKLYSHTGTNQGFNSQLTLIPEKNTGLFISVNSGNHLTKKSKLFINQLTFNILTQLMPECMVEEEKIKNAPSIGSVDEPLESFTGKYRYSWYGTSTLDKLGILIGSAPEIEIVQKDNGLEIVQWHDKLTPISGLTFHSIYDRYLAFGKGYNGEISYFFAESNTESYAWHKLRWYEPINFQKFWLGSIVIILLIYIIATAVRKIFVRNKKSYHLKCINFSLASLILIFLVLLTYSLITVNPIDFFYGAPLLLKTALAIPFIIIPLVLVGIYLLIKAYRFKELKPIGLIYQSLILAATLLFIPWLMYYNLIGIY